MPWLSNRRRLLILVIIDYLIINLIFLFFQAYEIINTKSDLGAEGGYEGHETLLHRITLSGDRPFS